MVSSGGGRSATETERRWWRVAMTVRVKGGYDPDYYFRQMGGKDAQAGGWPRARLLPVRRRAGR